ncbi:ATP-binding protein [Ramlibacter algicola]|uniref:histidine kinase n=1 Tax=Ramlibacter algicola TaxID=2795217 RepID=A0A934PYH0_9BURK|nr:ATP-binding protein [Ramlibacter algicola]MBK0391017.1 response regulator [Ramlibacter algicola]
MQSARPGGVDPISSTISQPPAAGSWGAWHLAVLERLAPPSLLLDGQHHVVHLSPQAGRFLQPGGGEPSQDVLVLAHPALREPLREALARAGANGQHATTEPVTIGSELVRARVQPAPEVGPGACLIVFEASHVTPPARPERLRSMVDDVRDYGIVALDAQKHITSWNRGAELLLGHPESAVAGESVDLLFTDDDRAAGLPAQMAQMAQANGQAMDERLLRREDGSQLYASCLWLPLRDAQSRTLGYVLVLRDLTTERQSSEALQRSQAELVDALADSQRARQQLEAAEAAKDRFLAVLSHELRNPLASIASASELLLMPKLPPAALEKAAQVVQRQARAMKVLLDELLDVSRLTLGRLTLTRKPVSIGDVVQSALDTTRPLVAAAGHDLVVRLPRQTVEVDGDPVRLAQVVSNLVSNAAKYTPEGGRIAIAAEVFHDEVVVSVEDNGIGMDPAEIERMFDVFSQGAQPAGQRSNGGLGIGLALARNIVELHGGWIMASSAGPGQGSQLRVGLPLLRVVQDEELPVVSVPPVAQPLPAEPAEGELILVADDSGDAAWGLAKLLELSGFRAVLARSGEEALRVAEQERPSIALLDIGMPDLSGHEVARRLRTTPWGRDMVLIAATGWGRDADVQQSLQAGFDAHLTKPLNVGRVRGLVEELSARHRRKSS